jgi:predicted nucleic acid-binding protein
MRKGSRCDARVASWYGAFLDDELYLSVIALGEIRQGIERLRRRNAHPTRALENWLAREFLPVDNRAAEVRRLSTLGTFAVTDALPAATAQAHGLTLVTRSVKDIADTGVPCVNPFEF